MSDRTLDLAAALTALDGPPGHEAPVADWLEMRWRPRCERIWRTPIGNLIAELGGRGPRLLLDAHLDELALLVDRIDAHGFVWLSGGRDDRWLLHLPECVNRDATILTPAGAVSGIFARSSGHLRRARGEEQRPPGFDNVCVDLGLGDRDAVLAAGVRPGCPVVYRAPARRLGERLAMKAADDRIALVVLTQLLESLDPAELTHATVIAATVQEELGAVGAASLRHDLGTFGAAVALEVAPAGDVPGGMADGEPVRLGGGPVLFHQEAAVYCDARLTQRLVELADAAGIAVQHAVMHAGGSDAGALIKSGIPTALLAIPTRYTHSAHELVDEGDVEGCVRLLRALATGKSRDG